MVVSLPDLNSSIISLRGRQDIQQRSASLVGGAGDNIAGVLAQQYRAAHESILSQGVRGEVLEGFINQTGISRFSRIPDEVRPASEPIITTLDSASDPYELRRDISALQNEVDALAGTFDAAGSELGGFLDEVVTIASPAALNHVIGDLTGRSMEELRGHLESFTLPDVSELVTQGIPQFDLNFQSVFGAGDINLDVIFSDITNRISTVIPSFGGNIIDDIIRDIDPNITLELQDMLGSNLISSIRTDILRNLVSGDLETAAELIRDFPTGLIDIAEIEERLAALDIDPMSILEGGIQSIAPNTQEILGGASTWNGANTVVTDTPVAEAGNNTSTGDANTYSFDFVDTAEEFESDIASSTRELDEVIIHMTGTPPSYNGDANDIHAGQTAAGYDGMQYHYIIRRDGRVQRGRPISSAGPSGGTQIDIAFVGTTANVGTYDASERFQPNDQAITTIQGVSYNNMMAALYRVIPGANTVGAGELESESTAPATEQIDPSSRPERTRPPFSPSNVNGCVAGRPGAGGWSGGGNSAEIRPYPGPGVSTDFQLTGATDNLDGVLVYILETAAERVGLSPVCTSGYRGSGGSGRHNGYASDTALYNGGRLLTVTVPDDLAYIQEYTRQFLSLCRENGENPSIGIANHAYNVLYMSGTSFHYDIARGRNIGINRGRYWGGSGSRSAHIPVPQWLVTMFAEEGF